MFNSKLKQQIAALEAANEQLQVQYNLVYDLLQQRQDEVVTLQRELADLPVSSSYNFGHIKNVATQALSKVLRRDLDFLSLDIRTKTVPAFLQEFEYCLNDSDSDSDEDEDEYYDSDFTDPNEDDED